MCLRQHFTSKGQLFTAAPRYIGEVDNDGRPHGTGFWYDSSFHGECLRGEWVHGHPAGMWFSRESGTGAHFLQCAVGYATSRSDCRKDRVSEPVRLFVLEPKRCGAAGFLDQVGLLPQKGG